MKYEQTHEVWTNTQIEVYAKVIWKKDLKKKKKSNRTIKSIWVLSKKKRNSIWVKKKKNEGYVWYAIMTSVME